MDILTEIQQEGELRRPCKVARWILTLSEEDQQQVNDALVSEHSTETLLRVFKRRGAVYSQNSLYKHRKRVCGCGD